MILLPLLPHVLYYCLMDWDEPNSSKPNLKKLLSFLTAITKQDKLAHVVLATSDYFLASWLYDRKFPDSFCFYVFFQLVYAKAVLISFDLILISLLQME